MSMTKIPSLPAAMCSAELKLNNPVGEGNERNSEDHAKHLRSVKQLEASTAWGAILETKRNSEKLNVQNNIVESIFRKHLYWFKHVTSPLCPERENIEETPEHVVFQCPSPHSGSTDDDKDGFYAQLEREYDRCPSHDVKIIIGDLNAQVGHEEEFRPTIEKFRAHQLTNENGLRLIDFAASKAIRSTFSQHSLPYHYTWRSPQQTESQIDHVLIEGRYSSDIIDVRTYRGANVDSDHYLVMVKLRPKLSVMNHVRYRRPPDLERLKQPDDAIAYAQHLEAALPDEEELDVAPLEDCWRTVKAANVAEDIVEYEERRRRNDWFDEECRAVLEKKSAARAVMLQHGTRQNVELYKQKRRQAASSGRKKRRLEEAECEEMELLYRSQDIRKFYQKLNASRKGFVPQTEICRDKDGSLLTDNRAVIGRWEQHFDEHLNGAENVGTDDQGNGGFDYVSVVEDGKEPTPTLREVKDAIQ
ncbi:uncharacterized protein LOC131680905 [Topomyia yanbarensis]|uniref:uncharacterized protein LOC131680905 n=1 Tax=Topomyia yanbarensis TaxID=2498891 RepID=UPI00273C38C7|nr:uncharacterized protein LOC131680905 [Topomyia yanbarensis]